MRYRSRCLGLTVPEIAKASQMYREGYSARQIALHFQCSKNAVQNALAYAGVKPRTPIEGLMTYHAMRADGLAA